MKFKPPFSNGSLKAAFILLLSSFCLFSANAVFATSEIDIGALVQSKNYDAAIAECKKAAASPKESPAFKQAYDNFALILDQSKAVKLDEAVDFYSNAPDSMISASMQPVFILVSHLRAANKFEPAAKILDRIKKISPDNSFFKATAPVVYSRVGRGAEAVEIINEELKRSQRPEYTKELNMRLADVYANSGKTKEALELLSEEMKKYPNDSQYAEFFTSISMRNGDFSKSMDLVKGNLQKNPADEGNMRALFTQAMASGNFDSALEHFQKLADEKPDDIAINTMVAELNTVAKNYDKAEKSVDKLIASQPKNTRAQLLKGRILFDRQQYKAALEQLLKTVEDFGDSVENKTHYYIAMSYLKTRDIVNALKHMNIELAKSPANSKILMREIEDALYSDKLFNTAITLFSELSAKNPGDADILTKLGLFYFYAGRADLALESLTRASNITPDSMSVNYILGVIHSEKKDAVKAKEYFEKCLSMPPDKLAGAFKIDSEQSALMIWPFAHHYFCYIHSALRLGQMEKVTTGLNELFSFLESKSPPAFVVKDVAKADPLTARFEYSIFRSFEFFAKNVLDAAYIKKIEAADEPKAILDFFLSKPGARENYDQSMAEQLKGNYEKAMNHIIEALKSDPDNPFLLIRGTSLGIWTNSYKIMPVASKMITIKTPDRALSDEEKFMYAYAKSLQVGAQGNVRAALFDALDHYKKTGAPKYDPRVIAEFENIAKAVKDTKFKKLNLMLASTLYFYQGNITESKKAVLEYIKLDPDLSTMIWFLHNIGSFILPSER